MHFLIIFQFVKQTPMAENAQKMQRQKAQRPKSTIFHSDQYQQEQIIEVPSEVPKNIIKQQNLLNLEPFSYEGDNSKNEEDENQRRKKRIKLKKIDRNGVFAYVSPKRAQKGNKNFVKFLVKSFFKHCYFHIDSQDNDFIEYVAQLKNKVYLRGPKNVTLNELTQIIGSGNKTIHEQVWCRNILRKIVESSKFIQEDIADNHFIKKKSDKKQHMFATKIYRLRLRNSLLQARTQTR